LGFVQWCITVLWSKTTRNTPVTEEVGFLLAARKTHLGETDISVRDC
jgi:hypothetical protein